MDLGIAGKTALVCAASKGLGRGCALALARNGVAVTITARNEDTLAAAATELARAAGITPQSLQQAGTREPAAAAQAAGQSAPDSGTPMLDQFGIDLTARARDGKLDPVIGRQDEIEQAVEILARRTKNNPVLIGEAGVGKTAVVEGLAQAITAGEVPAQLRGKRVVSLDLPAMLAGTRYRGDFEERLTNVLDFFLSAEGDETDLHVARDRERKAKDGKARTYTRQDLIADLEKEFGPDAVRRGRVLFAENCARCHSSIPDTPADSFKTRDFHAVAEDHPRKIRKDFLGNDASTPATEVGLIRPGLYRIDVAADSPRTIVTVRFGEAEVATGAGSVQVLPGQVASLEGVAGESADVRNMPPIDGFALRHALRNSRRPTSISSTSSGSRAASLLRPWPTRLRRCARPGRAASGYRP